MKFIVGGLLIRIGSGETTTNQYSNSITNESPDARLTERRPPKILEHQVD
jgi:hypothetical protein